MAISKFSNIRQRRVVGLVDTARDEAGESLLGRLGYELKHLEATDASSLSPVETLAAVLFQQSQDKPLQIGRALEVLAPKLLAADCRVFVRAAPGVGAATAAARKLALGCLSALDLPLSGLNEDEARAAGLDPNVPGLTPLVHVVTRDDYWAEIAESLQANPPEEPPNYGQEIVARDAKGNEITFCDEQRALLRRAFSNCTRVSLFGARDGLSGVKAFRAFATVASDGSTPWPHQYFVKIGARNKVATEWLAYKDISLEHVPYHLGPRLRLERCALGHKFGLIVSDYVGDSESLRDCAKSGRGVSVIANLFNGTLRAWREGSSVDGRSLQEVLSDRLAELTVPTHRSAGITAVGATKPLAELVRLIHSVPLKPVRVGVVHGDLHASNVLVRGHDAIIIDFEKVKTRAPLLRDMASLEGGLFVEGFEGDPRAIDEIMRSVSCLYELKQLLHESTQTCLPSDKSAWFFDCVRQIRMQALQIEEVPGQYAVTLAAELLKKACNPRPFEAPVTGGRSLEELRAMAYLLAEMIIVVLTGSRP